MPQQVGYFGIRYSDADEKPLPLETGEYGIYYDDNSDGTEVKRTFIDETGQPISNALSYASIVQSLMFLNQNQFLYGTRTELQEDCY